MPAWGPDAGRPCCVLRPHPWWGRNSLLCSPAGSQQLPSQPAAVLGLPSWGLAGLCPGSRLPDRVSHSDGASSAHSRLALLWSGGYVAPKTSKHLCSRAGDAPGCKQQGDPARPVADRPSAQSPGPPPGARRLTCSPKPEPEACGTEPDPRPRTWHVPAGTQPEALSPDLRIGRQSRAQNPPGPAVGPPVGPKPQAELAAQNQSPVPTQTQNPQPKTTPGRGLPEPTLL